MKHLAIALITVSFFFAFQRFGPLYRQPLGLLKLLGVLAAGVTLVYFALSQPRDTIPP